MRTTIIILTLLPLLSLPGCRADRPAASGPAHPASPGTGPVAPERTVAYINGKPVTQGELYRMMAPQVGGEALAEVALDRLVGQRLVERGVVLDDAAIQAERQTLLLSLSSDDDQAISLLEQMKQQRGLNDERFAALLRRNSGLRALVRDEVQIADAAVRQAYETAYGQRYQVRLLLSEKLSEAQAARAQVLTGADFSALASRLSTDVSRSQGGLLSPISPADATYPKAIRDALPSLKPDARETRLSPILAVDSGFALLYLEQVIPAQDVPFDRVEADLRRGVRLQLERVRMQQLARSLLEQANVVVLDPLLQPGWEAQGQAIRQGAEQDR